MTDTTTAPALPTTEQATAHYLARHGYASIDDAREDMVGFGCFGCGSIASVTATTEEERRTQVALIDWECQNVDCEDADMFVL